MDKYIFLLVAGIFFQANFTIAVPPLRGGSLFPRFQEFPDILPGEHDLLGIQTEGVYSPASRFRLPNQIVPRHYILELRPILNEGDEPRFTAPGKVQITVECLQPTNNLVLHAAELDINENTIRVFETENPSNSLTIQDTSFHIENETFTIQVQQTLALGRRYDVIIEYVAQVADPNDRMNGIYRSSYLDENNQQRFLATTQFSRTRAFRKTLPSFDEPSQKATFAISIGRQDPYHTLSNMDLLRSEPIPGMDGWMWDRYNTTPVMPPTIIAFIISDFEAETAPPDLFHPDKPVKIWGPPPEMKNGAAAFAAEAAAKILKHLEEYFDIEYELPKIDSAAIPDFAAGAMENWGLNTYRVMYLIWNEGINTVAEKFRCANIIGHELAHQFWGNLVTHAWWNDWWLTEGTASYFEYTVLERTHPEFEAVKRVVTSDVQPAMAFDSGPDSVPIHGSVTDQFVENPSVINYNKGAAIVRMMQGFLSEEVFRRALSFYLKERAYQAVHQDALFDDMTVYLTANNALPSNNKTMKEIMDTWTLQTSFPLIRVSRAGANRIYISQERYRNLGTDSKEEGLWHVPISFVTQSNPSFEEGNTLPKFWMDNKVLMTSHAVNTNQWIIFNPDGMSYYRVLYDSHFATLLNAQLVSNINSIPVGSRSMIVDDYFTSAYQGYISINDALRMTTFISKEVDYNVWVPFIKHLRKAFEMYSSNAQQFGVLKTFILNNMETALMNTGFQQEISESPVKTILRVLLFDWACSMGSPGCLNEANRLITAWTDNPSINPVPVDIRPYIYCAGATTAVHWVFLDSQYTLTKDPLIRDSLACSPSPTALQSLLTRTISEDSDILDSDAIVLIQRVAMNSDGRTLVISLLENRFSELVSSTRIRVQGVASIISTLSTYVRSSEELTKIQAIVTTNSATLQPVMNSINTSLARISANIQWMDDFGNSILTWISSPSP